MQGPSKHTSYIAPEVREGGAQSVQSDVFSLGLFLLQLITGSEASGLVQYTESALRQGKLASLLDPCAEGITSSSALPLAQLALRYLDKARLCLESKCCNHLASTHGQSFVKNGM